MDRPSESLFPHAVLEMLEHASAVPAFEQGTRTVSRSELLQLIRRLAEVLAGAGLGPGRSVAIFTAVSPEAFAAQIAAHALGCRVLGVRPGYSARQLAHVLGLQIDAVLVDASSATAELREAAQRAPLLSLGPCAGALDLLAQPDGGRPLRVGAQPDDIAWLTFTSGSTGQPKGCALTYRALGAHWSWQPPARWSPVAVQLAAGFERYMLFGTLASMVVMEFLALCLLGGGTAVIPEPDTRPLFPYAIARHRITGSIVTVPRLCQMLEVLRTDPVDVGSLRALMVSGSPLSPRRLASAIERLGPVVYHGYGQTEAGSISMLTPADIARCPERALSSVGRPHPGVEISVRDEQGRPVPATQAGELHVRSPYLMARYWELPEETSDVLHHGWLRTRDLVRLDEQGFLYLVGRTRDVIFVNAIVVYAGPIERVLAGHPDVAEAYVVGTPDDQTGEAVHAFIILARGSAPDRDALGALVRSELGEASVPKTISTVSSVPIAASGKPDKRALLDLYFPEARRER
jgi:acyl-CoA synthetase (AMP-forming)/AMP-acid ligase II